MTERRKTDPSKRSLDDDESDALLDSLFDEQATKPHPAYTSPRPPRPSTTTPPPVPASEDVAADLSDEDFEELAAGVGFSSDVGDEPHGVPPSEDEIEALLSHAASDSEPVRENWDAPTARMRPPALGHGAHSQAEFDAPTSRHTPLHEPAPSYVDLHGDSFASIPEMRPNDSFASIHDHELEDVTRAAAGPSSRPAFSALVPQFEKERPAVAHLSERNVRDIWAARAELLEREARAATDPAARSRGLLVASEVWAMTGDLARARELAHLASSAGRASSMVARQVRALAAAEGDWKSVASALELEATSAASHEARGHAAYFAAEVQRIALGDASAAQRRLDSALRADPNDPRLQLNKLVAQLSGAEATPRLRLPEAQEFESLSRAAGDAVKLRGGAASDSAAEPKLAFQAARRALALGNRAAAASAVTKLATVPGLERAALWLAAALAGAGPELRSRAVELLLQLASGPEAGVARRALAARALEQADASAMALALAPPADTANDPFSPADRVALSVLGSTPGRAPGNGGEQALLVHALQELALDENMRPLAAAAAAALRRSVETNEVLTGNERSRTAIALSTALLRAQSAVDSPDSRVQVQGTIAAYSAARDSSDASARLLDLELSLQQGRADRVAKVLGSWRLESARTETLRDQQLAAALLTELQGDARTAAQHYSQAIEADSSCEPAIRALIARSPGTRSSELLTQLAEASAENTHSSLLFVEAALHLEVQGAEFSELVERAYKVHPFLPFAPRLGEQAARARGDADELLKWLRLRRDSSTDPMERALDLVREALLVADTDMARAAGLLRAALEARPEDVALHELHERLSSEAGVERGRWREDVAASSTGPAKARLLLEAALEYERAGEPDLAARAAHAALEIQDSPLSRVISERASSTGADAARAAEKLFAQARSIDDVRAQRETYERLSELDRKRGDSSSALLWHSAILERSPEHLPALRRLEDAYIGGGRDEELEPVAAALARYLDPNEAAAHAFVSARLRTRSGAWDSAREPIELACRLKPAPLWALYAMSAHARASSDDRTLLEVSRALGESSGHSLDRATLALRAAEAALRLGKLADADRQLSRAVELVPEHPVALMRQAQVFETAGDYAGAASALEALAALSHVAAHRLQALHRAAVLWQDRVGDLARGQAALEGASQLEGAPEDVFARLQAVYVAQNDRPRLARLLEQRLARTTDPEQRTLLEVARGRALVEIGDREAARRALTGALDANPDHTEALAAFAELCVKDGDFANAEQALIRLARHTSGVEQQTEIYRRLGQLYENELGNPGRAELAYKEVLKRQPEDYAASERLVRVYGAMGDPARAIELQTELVARAESPELKREATLGFALAYEQIAGDRRKAEATLDKARKAWPQDVVVLRALAEFYQRTGEHSALAVLLNRSAADARRALQTGRFEPVFFEVLATVAELRGQSDAAAVARATLAALDGTGAGVNGAGAAAAARELDELLAPDLISPALRALLSKTGAALDSAYPIDLRALRAAPLPSESAALLGSIQRLAAGFGLLQCEVFVSPSAGRVCLPASTSPPRIVLGSALLETGDEAARYFLVVRALKILQGRAGALARTAPIELWPVLAGLITLLAPGVWQPQGVDARRLSEAQGRLRPALQTSADHDLPALALEVGTSIGNRASQLSIAVHQWGNRAGLLALGDPSAALRAIASAGGHAAPLPDSGTERLKWIVRHPEARDLAVFSVSEHYAEARKRTNLNRS